MYRLLRFWLSLLVVLSHPACATDVLRPIPTRADITVTGVDREEEPDDSTSNRRDPPGDPIEPTHPQCEEDAVVACYTASAATRGVGECRDGIRRCDANGKWGPCVGQVGPVAEVCDGLDNDCDGDVDENLGATQCGRGECMHAIPNCVDGRVQVCDPREGATAEVCDNLDNDCDGNIDEGLGDATITCGVGQCFHSVTACVDGQVPKCDPLEGATAEVCDGVDNDCDGLVDEDLGTLSCGRGVCAHTIEACVGGQPQTCDPFLGASPEVCDGLDNDCDGDIDEDFSGETTTCGVGECVHTVAACDNGEVPTCDPMEGAMAEICDGRDNDCDGLIDEDLGETQCGQGVCRHTVPNCSGGHPQFCNPFAGAGPEICDGLDNDCDGDIDEGFGDQIVSCGVGQCAHTVTACTDGQVPTCDPFEGATAEICDGVDNDCDGLVDEDQGETQCGQGLCARTVANCVGGQVQSCDPFAGASAEICDGLDNDCDGLVDEDQGEIQCGLGVCSHAVAACVNGVPQFCNPFEGATLEVCDGLDNDCDGLVDEDQGQTTCGLGLCNHTVANCFNGWPQTCDPFDGASAEICDGIDNDCDGLIDEDLGVTTCGQGVCNHTIPNCVSGQPQTCDPFAGASTEVCDGLDNDCDGQVDEGFSDVQVSCGLGQCAHTVNACVNGQVITCDPLEGASAEICDGVDNDCDGLVDEDLGTWSCGEGACLTLVPRCINGVPQPEHACDPTNDEVELCGDGIDNNCDGDAPPCYESYTAGTVSTQRSVDVVWAIDSSGSMRDEMATVETNLNAFAGALSGAAAASSLHLIADRGTEDLELCVPTPLGGPACADNPPEFYQYDTNGSRNGDEMVHSSNALGRIMQQHYAWGPRLQTGSHIAFIITTDDDGDDPTWTAPNDTSELNDCTSTNLIEDNTDENYCRWKDPTDGTTYTSLANDHAGLAGFKTFMAKKFPKATAGKDWTVYPIIGATGNKGLHPSLRFNCPTAVESGEEYVKLALFTGTENEMTPICSPDWDLAGLATAIVNNVPQNTFVLQGGQNCAAINPATIEVRINGVLLAAGDWMYDPATCELRINNNVPSTGDTVDVTFELY